MSAEKLVGGDTGNDGLVGIGFVGDVVNKPRVMTQEEVIHQKLLQYGFAITEVGGREVIISQRERVAVTVLP